MQISTSYMQDTCKLYAGLCKLSVDLSMLGADLHKLHADPCRLRHRTFAVTVSAK